jgi:hypothetical protein
MLIDSIVARIGIALLMAPAHALAGGGDVGPGELAIYYGFPSLVNGSGGDLSLAASVFASYEMVVLGDGLQDPGHPDHSKTRSIISMLPGVEVHGYIPMGQLPPDTLSLSQIQARIDDWNGMGVTGVFLDEAGWDYHVSRQLLNSAIQHAHGIGLSTFVNAWNPDDVFSPTPDAVFNPAGDASLLGPADIYLLESYQIVLSGFQDPLAWTNKADKASAWRDLFGTRMATVTTVSAAEPGFEQAMYDYAWYSTLLYGFEFSAWGELFFSASDSQMPFRQRPAIAGVGSSFTGAVQHAPPLHSRTTETGTITIDTSAHQGSFQLLPCLASGLCSAYCFGDGTETSCPCGNDGANGVGCANSTGQGALLASTGTSDVTTAELALTGFQLPPNKPCLYFGGSNALAGLPFGDGLRCVGGGIKRLQLVLSDALGTSLTTVDLASKMGAVSGDTHRFQIWYRDPPGLCGSAFNLSNGFEVLWL